MKTILGWSLGYFVWLFGLLICATSLYGFSNATSADKANEARLVTPQVVPVLAFATLCTSETNYDVTKSCTARATLSTNYLWIPIVLGLVFFMAIVVYSIKSVCKKCREHDKAMLYYLEILEYYEGVWPYYSFLEKGSLENLPENI